MSGRFLVVYDYGQGGLWSYVSAPSKEAIQERFPELQVFDAEPDWMSEPEKRDIAARGIEELDGPYREHGVLATALAIRARDAGERP
jgi:hypothetical protein